MPVKDGIGPEGHFQGVPTIFTTQDHIAAAAAETVEAHGLGLSPRDHAYVIEWTSEQARYTRRHFRDAKELRMDVIAQGAQGAQQEQQEKVRGMGRLFVIQGPPAEYMHVLRETLEIEPRFIEAHVRRRSYRRSLRTRRGRGGSGGAEIESVYFEYPELMTPLDRRASLTDAAGRIVDGTVGESLVHTISAGGDAAAFCRASLWLGPKGNVLLLDHPSPTFSRGQTLSKRDSVTLSNDATSIHDETPSFETLLYANLNEVLSNESGWDVDLASLVEDIALHQWTEFFEALPTDTTPDAALYLQAQKSLERSLNMSSTSTSISTADWQSLLSRLLRRAELQRHLGASIQLPSKPFTTATTTTTISPLTGRRRTTLTPTSIYPYPTSSPSSSDENKRSLDRVSYMGGVLLPLSIVSSILSMSDPFNPGGSLFWVFWATGVPLVFVAVLVIYADSIRKAEVWIEDTGTGEGEKKKKTNNNNNNNNNNRVSTPVLEQGRVVVVPGRAAAGGGLRIAAMGPAVVLGEGGGREEEKEKDEDDGDGDDDDDDDEGGYDPIMEEVFREPAMMVEKRFRDAKQKKWKKQQLGWAGACMTALQLYHLKKGRPPNWAADGRRHGRRI